jgi:hypothetical protein
MREGFVVMLDALGYKGIWRARQGESEEQRAKTVIEKMKELRKQATRLNRVNAGSAVDLKCECISDTIVIGFSQEPSSTGSASLLILGAFIASFFDAALRSPPPLAYRGAVSYGRFEMDDGFVVGPAIDDAAEHMELAEGAFVWATPSALERLAAESEIAFKYDVPLKGGISFETLAFAPWAMVSSDLKDITEQAEILLATFNRSDLSVQVKRQNTRRFLNHALKEARELPLKFAKDPTSVAPAPVLD